MAEARAILRRFRWPLLGALALLALPLWNAPFFFTRNVGAFDWWKDLYFLQYLRTSLIDYGSYPFGLIAVPARVAFAPSVRWTFSFWANPETPAFSPLLAPLPFLDLYAFVKLYLFAHLAIGALGVLALARRLGLAPLFALALCVLLAFNPWLMQHLAIGYLPRASICFAPWIAHALLAPRFGRGQLVAASSLGALMLYEGGLHPLLWTSGVALTLSALAAVRERSWRWPLRVGLSWCGLLLLALPRIVAGLRGVPTSERFVAPSYASIGDLWGLFADAARDPLASPGTSVYGTALHDASVYMGPGWLALLAIALASILLRHRAAPRRILAEPGLALFACGALFVALGWNGVWAPIVEWLPPLGAERHPYRFLVVPLFLWSAALVVELELVTRGRPLPRTLALLAIAAVAVPLWQRNSLFTAAATARHPSAYHDVVDVRRQLRDEISVRGVRDGTPATEVAVEVTPNGLVFAPVPGIEAFDVTWLAFTDAWAERVDPRALRGLSRVRRPVEQRGKPNEAAAGFLHRSYVYRNADPEPAAGWNAFQPLRLRVRDPAQPVAIEARRHHAVPLAAGALLGFAALLAALRGPLASRADTAKS